MTLLPIGLAWALSTTPAPVPLSSTDPTLAPMAWLAGAWAGEADGRSFEEHWTHAAGGSMLGVHREIKGGKTAFFEQLRIEVGAQGAVVYTALPSFAPTPTAFALHSAGEGTVRFDNPGHDWPTSITYTRTDTGMEAKASGGGKEAVWVYRRAVVVPGGQ